MKREMDTRKHVKFLIAKNLLYEIGLKDIKLIKILQGKTENQFLIKLQNHK
jgi:hypothetical protein